jgi:hypothetical protein
MHDRNSDLNESICEQGGEKEFSLFRPWRAVTDELLLKRLVASQSFEKN